LLAPNVAPANEAPKEVLIYNHNESPQVPMHRSTSSSTATKLPLRVERHPSHHLSSFSIEHSNKSPSSSPSLPKKGS
jgi:hypothetical protein